MPSAGGIKKPHRYRTGTVAVSPIRGGENPEAALPYFWKIFDFYFEISNFMLDFPTPIST
jgi:hypothetical protein